MIILNEIINSGFYLTELRWLLQHVLLLRVGKREGRLEGCGGIWGVELAGGFYLNDGVEIDG